MTSRRLGSARAYYRLAVKADMAGNSMSARAYRHKADTLVAEDRRAREREANYIGLTLDDVAKQLGVTREYVLQLIKQKQLATVTVRDERRVPFVELVRFKQRYDEFCELLHSL